MTRKTVPEWFRAGMVLSASIAVGANAFADGTETLGDPVGLTVADGTGYAAAGVGLSLGQPADINLSVPPGASVVQAILYWEGNSPTPLDVPATDTVQVNGSDVTGSFIGGGIGADTGATQFLTYRADITALGAVAPGDNLVAVSGLDFGQNNGAGILAVIDEGGDKASLLLKDGSDRAYINSAAPMDTTVPQLFTFEGAGVDRTVTLYLFFSDVAGQQSGATALRPTRIAVWLGNDMGGEPTFVLENALASNDGEEWDTVIIPVDVPAGETMLQVQALSEGEGGTPASFSWITAGLRVPPPPVGGEGCTPGYWKQPQHFGSWTSPYTPDTPFADVFEDAFPGMTLLEVAGQGGGGLIALGRHTVAALLNGASGGVDYDLSAADVINAFNDAYPGSRNDYNRLKNRFEAFNEQGCPLGRDPGGDEGDLERGRGANGNAGSDDEVEADNDDEVVVSEAGTDTLSTSAAPSATSSSGGGGTAGLGFLLGLAGVAGLRRLTRKNLS
jgi:hypothetical protein